MANCGWALASSRCGAPQVRIGDKTQSPGVQILTAGHPRSHEERSGGLELGRPIVIGRNVWIGGGAILLPGITVSDDALIGAGSAFTRDMPAGATVVGNPSTRERLADAQDALACRAMLLPVDGVRGAPLACQRQPQAR